MPNFDYEKLLWSKGFNLVAGLDEVGRGAIAGPVVAGCVVFDKSIITAINTKGVKDYEAPTFPKIDDSKRLTRRQRGQASRWIKANALAWGVGSASVGIINKVGIVKAAQMAFRKALYSANELSHNRIEYLLIDAFYVPYIRGFSTVPKNTENSRLRGKYFEGKHRQLPIIKGDTKSFTIAASSIIAKVYRDNFMVKLSTKNKKIIAVYEWEQNKGYATLRHRKSIKENGITKHHRKLFVRKLV